MTSAWSCSAGPDNEASSWVLNMLSSRKFPVTSRWVQHKLCVWTEVQTGTKRGWKLFVFTGLSSHILTAAGLLSCIEVCMYIWRIRWTDERSSGSQSYGSGPRPAESDWCVSTADVPLSQAPHLLWPLLPPSPGGGLHGQERLCGSLWLCGSSWWVVSDTHRLKLEMHLNMEVSFTLAVGWICD